MYVLIRNDKIKLIYFSFYFKDFLLSKKQNIIFGLICKNNLIFFLYFGNFSLYFEIFFKYHIKAKYLFVLYQNILTINNNLSKQSYKHIIDILYFFREFALFLLYIVSIFPARLCYYHLNNKKNYNFIKLINRLCFCFVTIRLKLGE